MICVSVSWTVIFVSDSLTVICVSVSWTVICVGMGIVKVLTVLLLLPILLIGSVL